MYIIKTHAAHYASIKCTFYTLLDILLVTNTFTFHVFLNKNFKKGGRVVYKYTLNLLLKSIIVGFFHL